MCQSFVQDPEATACRRIPCDGCALCMSLHWLLSWQLQTVVLRVTWEWCCCDFPLEPAIAKCATLSECRAEAPAAGERRSVRHSTLSQHDAPAREDAAGPSPVASRAGSATSQRSAFSTHSHGGGHISFAANVVNRLAPSEV